MLGTLRTSSVNINELSHVNCDKFQSERFTYVQNQNKSEDYLIYDTGMNNHNIEIKEKRHIFGTDLSTENPLQSGNLLNPDFFLGPDHVMVYGGLPVFIY